MDEESWQAKQTLLRRQTSVKKETAAFMEYAAFLHRHADALPSRHLLRYRRGNRAAAASQPVSSQTVEFAPRPLSAARRLCGVSRRHKRIETSCKSLTEIDCQLLEGDKLLTVEGSQKLYCGLLAEFTYLA